MNNIIINNNNQIIFTTAYKDIKSNDWKRYQRSNDDY